MRTALAGLTAATALLLSAPAAADRPILSGPFHMEFKVLRVENGGGEGATGERRWFFKRSCSNERCSQRMSIEQRSGGFARIRLRYTDGKWIGHSVRRALCDGVL